MSILRKQEKDDYGHITLWHQFSFDQQSCACSVLKCLTSFRFWKLRDKPSKTNNGYNLITYNRRSSIPTSDRVRRWEVTEFILMLQVRRSKRSQSWDKIFLHLYSFSRPTTVPVRDLWFLLSAFKLWEIPWRIHRIKIVVVL